MEKSAVAGEFADIVEEGLRAFNVDRLYGGEIKVDDLVDATATLPDDGAPASRRRPGSREAADPEARVEGRGRGTGAAGGASSAIRLRTRPPSSSAEVDKRRQLFKVLMQGRAGRRLRDDRRPVGRRSVGEGTCVRAEDLARCRRPYGRSRTDGTRPRPSARGARAAGALRDGAGGDQRRGCSTGGAGWAGGAGGLRHRQRDLAERPRGRPSRIAAVARRRCATGDGAGTAAVRRREATGCAVAEGDRRGVPDGPGAQVFWRGTAHAPRAAGRGIVRGPDDLRGALDEPLGQPGLVATGRVAVDDALGRHLVHNGHGLLSAAFAPSRSLASSEARMALRAVRSLDRSCRL